MPSTLIRVCGIDEVAPGTARRFELPGLDPVALFNLEGTFHAIADTCTHQRASLSDGEIDGDEVICPLHFQVFHIPTGEAREGITKTCLATHEVVVHDDAVYLETT
jgi:nitrite reductase/ring-hydroxylating ferredoxin subunit